MNIVGISGSLRKKSYNTALLRAAQELAPNMGVEILDISTLPLYNQDVEEADYPQASRDLRAQIAAADGVLFAVPEFNRTMPAPLKNFLDWTSRPESEQNPWEGKKIGIFGSSSGPRGASFAQYDVRRVMGYFNARVMGQPEVYIGLNAEKFDADLRLSDERTKVTLIKFLTAFTQHLQK